MVHWQRSPKVLSRSRPFEIQLKFIYLLDVGGDALRAMFTPSQVHHSLRSDRGVNDARRAGQSEQISVQTDDGRYIRVSHKLAFRERAAIPQRRDSADATPLTDQTPERQTVAWIIGSTTGSEAGGRRHERAFISPFTNAVTGLRTPDLHCDL